MTDIHAAAYTVLMESDPLSKCNAMHTLYQAWLNDKFTYIETDIKIERIQDPGRPQKPQLVSPKKLPKRSLHTDIGRIIFMHAIAHIEFNAINLALDAVYRFTHQPKAYYQDWLKVADDEARHFKLIYDYLQAHDCQYGDYPAHNGLWEMTEKTDHNILHRMALIPRVLEARGLDVSPSMIDKLRTVGDVDAAKILNIIYQDEISHVETGSRWFYYHCQLANLDAEQTFIDIVNQYMHGKVRGPFNEAARLIAGFKQEELDRLNSLAN